MPQDVSERDAPLNDSRTDLVRSQFFIPEGHVLRLLTDSEWRGIGITQSVGWKHYEVRSEARSWLLSGS